MVSGRWSIENVSRLAAADGETGAVDLRPAQGFDGVFVGYQELSGSGNIEGGQTGQVLLTLGGAPLLRWGENNSVINVGEFVHVAVGEVLQWQCEGSSWRVVFLVPEVERAQRQHNTDV